MSASAGSALGPTLGSLAEALDRLVPAALRDPRALPALEGALEALYAAALHEPRSASAALETALARHAGRHPAIPAWRALVRLRFARKGTHREALRELEATLVPAPPRTRWLTGVEAGRLVSKREGAAPAWVLAASVAPVLQDDAWGREGPLTLPGVLTWLRLAGTAGEWSRHDALGRAASTYWPEGSPPSIRVELLLADQAIQRGRFRETLDRLDAVEEVAQGDLRVHLLCTRLHALAALGRGERPRARNTYRALRRAARGPGVPEHGLPDAERRALRRRGDRIARQAGLIPEARRRGGPVVTRLLELEQKARRMRRDPEAKVRLLFDIVERAEAALCRSGPIADVEGWLRLRLLRCRVLVDLAAQGVFPDCIEELGQVYDEATRRGLAPLAMLALDQRAVVNARSRVADWPSVVEDSSGAAALAVELLAANAAPSGARRAVERTLLADLLPVFDRVLALHAEGALRIAARHPWLLTEPIPSYHDAREAETPEGSWVRFGRVIHAYAEQTQALALQEARRAYAAGRTSPSALAITAAGPPRVVVDELCAALPRGHGVLQWFVFGPHVLVFVFGRDVFDWHAAPAPGVDELTGPARAHEALGRLIETLRAFTRGEGRTEDRARVGSLSEALLPAKIQAILAGADLHHLRLVPHDVLYRVPFGKLIVGSTPLAQRFSTSLHPTGRLAVSARPEERARGGTLGHVTGPDVACLDEDTRAIRSGVGSLLPLAAVARIDTAAEGLSALSERALAHDVLHFTCHGTEGDALSPPVLRLGAAAEVLDLAGTAALRLRPGALVVLQSCWTGWMDHERRNPVQGFPQAFRDAGAAAVIAPLVPLPEALAPFFSNVLYRALRFLPAEEALHRALGVLRAHGPALVAAHPEALAMLHEHGSMDAFEYRYAGAPGLRFGGLAARLVGRVSFWWWLRRVSRGARLLPELIPGGAVEAGRLGSG
jgi:hypothetical protein